MEETIILFLAAHNMTVAELADKYETDVQLLQTTVIESVCKHCNNKLCDSQTFNQQCFKCGKKPL